MDKEYLNKNGVKKIVNGNNSPYFILECWNKFLNEYSCKPNNFKFPKYKIGDIIDKNMSIKWNKEEVDRCIVARNEEVKRLNKEKNEINQLYKNGIIKVFAKEYKITIAETKIFLEEAYYNSSSINTIVDIFEDLVSMYKKL